jgi:hypothetical protein
LGRNGRERRRRRRSARPEQGTCAATMPRRRLRRVSPSQPPPLLVVLLHPLRLENLGEHRFDLPSATEPHLRASKGARAQSGGAPRRRLRSPRAPFRATADSWRDRLQENGPALAWPTSLLWGGALSAKPLPPPMCGQTPARRQAGHGWLVSRGGYDVPPKNGGGHGAERTRRFPKRYSDDANGTASRPQGSPFRATCAFSRGKGEAASRGAGRAGAVSARAVGEGRIASGVMKPLRICGRNRREDAAE